MSVKPARNDACPCGSGRKYKHCCAALGAPRARAGAPKLNVPTEAETRELVAFLDAKRPADAEAAARRLLMRFPGFGFAWNMLGVAQLFQGKDALGALQRAVALLPHDALAHSNLAFAQRQHGLAADSVASCRRAIELNPRLAEAHNNLGTALLDLGQPDEALASYGQAVQLNPRYVDALCNLATLLRTRGQLQDAGAVFNRALQVAPQYAPAIEGIGHVLAELGRPDEALDAYRRALALDPANARTLVALATVLRQLGNYTDAEALANRGLEAQPTLAPAMMLLGDLHEDRGQFTEAAALYRRALEGSSAYAPATIALVRHREGPDEDAAWLAAAQGLEGRVLALRDAIGLQYALGDYHDAHAAYDQAFTHYRAANDLHRHYGVRYDRERNGAQFARVRGCFDRAWFSGAAAGADATDQPVFIVGMPRTGTTLVEQILASHPRVFGAGEPVFWLSAAASFDAALQEGKADADLKARMVAEYLRMLRKVGGDAARIIDKTPSNYLALGLIHGALPNARIIHMTRDPRDTGLSIYATQLGSGHPYATDLGDIACQYGEYRTLMRHWQEMLPAGSILDVSYEDLVADTASVSRRLVEFIGLDWDPRCLDFPSTPRIVTSQSKWQVRRPVSAARIGRWRHYEAHLGPLLDLAG